MSKVTYFELCELVRDVKNPPCTCIHAKPSTRQTPNAVNGESQGTLCIVRRLFAQLLSFQIVPSLAAAAPPPPAPPPPPSSPPPAAQNLCLVKQSKIPSLSAQSLSRTLQVTLFQTLYLG